MIQTTRLSKVFAAVLILGYLVELFVPDTSDYVALVPGRTLPCVWNLVTSGLLTVNPVELVINVAALFLLARLVEPIYGSKEFLRFIFVVDLLNGCVVFVAVYVAYILSSGKDGALLYTQFTGFHGIIAALLVAVKQIMPLHELKLLSVIKIQVKYLPSILLVPVVAASVALSRRDYLAFYLSGTYLGWLYLRFFQPQPDTNTYGDASDDFKFSSFFPDFMAPVIDPVAYVFGLVTRFRHAPGDGSASKPLHAQVPSVLGSDAADAHRRRERGAKALEERLGLKSGSSVPVDVEAGSESAATDKQEQP